MGADVFGCGVNRFFRLLGRRRGLVRLLLPLLLAAAGAVGGWLGWDRWWVAVLLGGGGCVAGLLLVRIAWPNGTSAGRDGDRRRTGWADSGSVSRVIPQDPYCGRRF